MQTNSPAPMEVDLDSLEALLAKASPQRLETAEAHDDDQWLECPFCAGEGEVDGETFTNYDDAAIGVQFFGVGDQFVHNEKAFRALWEAAPALIAHIRTLEAKLSESEAATKLAGAVSVNADLICAVIKEEGDVPAEYLAVKIANTLDPPNTPNWDAAQVVRLYSALRTVEGQTLTHTAQRSIDMIVAAKATAAEEAAKAERARCAKRIRKSKD